MEPEWLSVVVSIVALFVSVTSILMNIRIRRKVILENAKLVITKNVASINGIQNSAAIVAANNPGKKISLLNKVKRLLMKSQNTMNKYVISILQFSII